MKYGRKLNVVVNVRKGVFYYLIFTSLEAYSVVVMMEDPILGVIEIECNTQTRYV